MKSHDSPEEAVSPRVVEDKANGRRQPKLDTSALYINHVTTLLVLNRNGLVTRRREYSYEYSSTVLNNYVTKAGFPILADMELYNFSAPEPT